MKKIFAIITIMAFTGLMIPGAMIGDSAALEATVTIINLSLEIGPASFDYGVMSEGGERKTASSTAGVTNGIFATSTANVEIDINIYGGNASSTQTTNWTLAGATSTDQYTHEFANNIETPTWAALGDSGSQASLATNVAIGAAEDFDLRINTPLTSTDTGPFYIPVTVVAVDST